jgi:hypothetical protein
MHGSMNIKFTKNSIAPVLMLPIALQPTSLRSALILFPVSFSALQDDFYKIPTITTCAASNN